MTEKIAVIGLGRFGKKLAQALSAKGAEVIAIDKSRELAEALRDQVALSIKLDATDEESLLAQGIDKVDTAVVAIGTDFEANALATSTLKSIGVKRVISRAGSEIRGEILRRINADDIVFPEHESATRWVNKLLMPQVFESIELDEDHSLVQLKAPTKFQNSTLQELNLRQTFEVNVMAIRRLITGAKPNEKQETIIIPLPETKIEPGDILWIIASNQALRNLPRD